jgi:hypothetical protein
MRRTVHPATDRDLQVVARFVAAAQGAADSGALTLGALGEPPAPFRTSPLSAGSVQGEWVRAQDRADGDPPPGSGPTDRGVVLYLPAAVTPVSVTPVSVASVPVTPVPATTPATGTVSLAISGKIIGGYLPTSGTFSSNDHRR